METKAHHAVVGAFVIAAVIGAFAFVIWLSQFQVERRYAEYDVVVRGAVSGLNPGADVRFNGIRVGEVSAIAIDPEDTTRVRIRLRIDAATPVKTDSTATLETQGLTGVAIVQITGGGPDSKLLEPPQDQAVAEIPYVVSGLGLLVEGAPDVVAELRQVASDLRALLTQENRDALGTILKNVAAASGELPEIARHARTVSAEIAEAAPRLSAAIASVDTILAADGKATAANIREAAASLRGLAEEAAAAVKELQPLASAASGSVRDFGRASDDLRRVLASLDRLARRLEEQPSALITSGGPPEYTPRARGTP